MTQISGQVQFHPSICSAVMEFLCDLTYNVTMSRIHASVQGLVFQSVLRQDITFFDNNKPGKFIPLISCRISVPCLLWYFGTKS